MRKLFSFLIFILFFIVPLPARACESCSCAVSRSVTGEGVHGSKTFFDMTVEQILWRSRSASDAHTLHHQGHHTHNITHEEFTNFMAGFDAREDLTLLAEIPYVRRRIIEIDSHAFLGQKQRSEGWGDAKLSALWRFWRSGDDLLGALGGIKLPTGSTDERNPQGVRFDGEMQPGTGSTDGFLGGVFQKSLGILTLRGNAAYAIRGKGDYDFRLGNSFSSYVILDTPVVSSDHGAQAWLGVDSNLQIEGRHAQDDVENADSGGPTWSMGPSLKIQASDRVVLATHILFPVYQDPGGVHQKLDLVWNVSVRARW